MTYFKTKLENKYYSQKLSNVCKEVGVVESSHKCKDVSFDQWCKIIHLAALVPMVTIFYLNLMLPLISKTKSS